MEDKNNASNIKCMKILMHTSKRTKVAEQKAGKTNGTHPSSRAQNVVNTSSKKSNMPITP